MTDKLETELAALKARSEEQQARIEELERKANPPAPPKFESGERGPTTTELAMSRASISREAMQKLVEAVPDAEVRGILRDGRASQNLRPLAEANARPRPAATGWEAPLSPPPGSSLIDRQIDVQDAKDRAERRMQHARMKAVEKK
jgi:hypothetical protein